MNCFGVLGCCVGRFGSSGVVVCLVVVMNGLLVVLCYVMNCICVVGCVVCCRFVNVCIGLLKNIMLRCDMIRLMFVGLNVCVCMFVYMNWVGRLLCLVCVCVVLIICVEMLMFVYCVFVLSCFVIVSVMVLVL